MKKKKPPTPIAATKEQAESVRRPASDQWIQLRVTQAEKDDISNAATLSNRTVKDYLLACHAAIAAKLRE